MRRTLSATLLAAMVALLAPAQAWAATYYVAPTGNDADAGSTTAPWKTLQRAADRVTAGDRVVVRPGSYAGFYLKTSGSAGKEIVFSAEPGVSINKANAKTPDGINLEGASHVVIEGFTVSGVDRAGIRSVLGEHVTLRANRAEQNGRWGILTGFVDDVVIEDNFTSGSKIEHGIYVSNSGDRPVIRRNVVWNNARNGIHMNGDAEQGGDGIITGAVVEANTIYSNGADGGSAINCDGVQDSVIVNNLIYDARASGISLYRIDGGGPSSGNLIINNTVIVSSTGRWALNVQDNSGGNQAFNNIFFNQHPSRGAINLCGPGCAQGFESDYNIVVDRFTADDSSVITLAAWRSKTGQDQHSMVCEASTVFVDMAKGDYRVTDASAARDVGTDLHAPPADHDGNARPSGAAVDIGAFEYCGTACRPTEGGAGGSGGMPQGGSASSGGTGGGTGGAAGGNNSGAGESSAGGGSGGAAIGGGANASGGANGGASARGGASASGGASSKGGASTSGAGSPEPSAEPGAAAEAGCSIKALPRGSSLGAFCLAALGLLAWQRRRGS